jgi:general secretion pathway protein E
MSGTVEPAVRMLVDSGNLTPEDLERAQADAERGGQPLRVSLVKLGMVTARQMQEAVGRSLGIPSVDLRDFPPDPEALKAVPAELAYRHQIIPIKLENGTVIIATADPFNLDALDDVRMVTGREANPVLADASEIQRIVEDAYMKEMMEAAENGDVQLIAEKEIDAADLERMAKEALVIRLVNTIIRQAVTEKASDIHIEPFENRLVVRYRIDGVLHEVESPPRRLSAAVISRIKIMANLDIAERRLPQDGRIRLRVQGKEIDLRVSTVPTMHGESVVMRILDKGGVALDFKRLGFEEDSLAAFTRVLLEPHGILLVTGPTGSGKTTTLYTALDTLNKPDVKILTVEDPVEYQMPGINQIQVKPQIDLTFANALRSIVRQDPDVIMIGEIRDLETAQIAVQSALTGHLVLSTVHTNDASSTVNRLLDMGVEDYLLTSTVIGILAQRLVRTLCEHCKEPYVALPEMVEELGLARYTTASEITLFHPKGCGQCAQTGYTGRIGIMEMLPMTDPLRSLVMKHATAGELREEAVRGGMMTMYEDGLRKAVHGVTTFEEVLRVTRES